MHKKRNFLTAEHSLLYFHENAIIYFGFFVLTDIKTDFIKLSIHEQVVLIKDKLRTFSLIIHIYTKKKNENKTPTIFQ